MLSIEASCNDFNIYNNKLSGSHIQRDQSLESLDNIRQKYNKSVFCEENSNNKLKNEIHSESPSLYNSPQLSHRKSHENRFRKQLVRRDSITSQMSTFILQERQLQKEGKKDDTSRRNSNMGTIRSSLRSMNLRDDNVLNFIQNNQTSRRSHFTNMTNMNTRANKKLFTIFPIFDKNDKDNLEMNLKKKNAFCSKRESKRESTIFDDKMSINTPKTPFKFNGLFMRYISDHNYTNNINKDMLINIENIY